MIDPDVYVVVVHIYKIMGEVEDGVWSGGVGRGGCGELASEIRRCV